MKVVLINPPCRAPTLMPLGLGYIASVLRQRGHAVILLDLNAAPRPLQELEREIITSHADVIGIGGLTTTYKYVKELASLIRRASPRTPIVAGNMVSTADPRLLLEHSDVDICVIDEGELTAQELFSAINAFPDIDRIKGIAFKRDGRIMVTEPRRRIENLDSLPWPAWDLFPIETYIKSAIHLEYGRRSLNVSAVRGCPFQCIYCSRPFGSKVYMRSPEGVIGEIKELKRRYRIEYVGFCDDLFMVDRKWLMKLCGRLIDERLHIGWGSSARVNLVDPELLRMMKKAGCEMLNYGFESGSQRILDIIKKGVKVRDAEYAIEITRKAGIALNGSFMFGMIGETEETVNETVAFIKRTGLVLDKLFFTTPYPGTPLYETAKKMGRILQDEDAYVSSLGEMYNTFLVNLTDMKDEKLVYLKEDAERRIKANLPMSARLEIFEDNLRRRYAAVREKAKSKGLLSVIPWLFGRLRHKMAGS